MKRRERPITPAAGAVWGAFIGAGLVWLGYLLNDEAPPSWLIFLGTIMIFTPIAIWVRSKNKD